LKEGTPWRWPPPRSRQSSSGGAAAAEFPVISIERTWSPEKPGDKQDTQPEAHSHKSRAVCFQPNSEFELSTK
jgi:hypothetical protein